MSQRQGSRDDDRALLAVRQQLRELMEEPASIAPLQVRKHVGEMDTMPLQASNTDSFEQQVQEQLVRIASQLDVLGRRLDEERGFAPQRPEEVPGYAELKTALHNLVEHLELAEGRTAEAIGALHEKLEDVAARTSRALEMAQRQNGRIPGTSIKALEERIEQLNARLAELQQGHENTVRSYVNACIGELQERLEAVEQAPAGGMSEEDIRRLVGEHVQAEAAAQAQRTEQRMSAMVSRLQDKLEELAAGVMDVDRLRTDVEQLEAQVQSLTGQLEQKAERAETQALKERLDAMAAQLEATSAASMPGDDARLHALEEQVLQIRQLVEEVVGEPLALIGDKLAQHEQQLAELRNAEDHAERLARMEQAIAQLQQALRDHDTAEGSTAHAHEDEIAALKAGLADVEKFSREADAKMREMLQAVHETLAEVVERLITLEEQPPVHQKDAAKNNATPASDGGKMHAKSARAGNERQLDDLLGEPAPEATATSMPRAAEADSPAEASDPTDLAAEVAQVVASLHNHDPSSDSEGAPDDSIRSADAARQDSNVATSAQEVDDFIAAARRAALAASTHPDTQDNTTPKEGLLQRLGVLARRKRSTENDSVPTAESALSEDTTPRRSIMTSLGNLRRAGSKDADDSTGNLAAEGEKPVKAAGSTRTRLLLAGLVLLSAATLIISRQQAPQDVAQNAPAAVQAEQQNQEGEHAATTAPSGTQGAKITAPGKAGADAEAGTQASQPPGSPASEQKEEKPGSQASLNGSASTGLFAPQAGGMAIHTASIVPAQDRLQNAEKSSAAGLLQRTAIQAQRVMPLGMKADKATDLPKDFTPVALRQAALQGDGKAAYVVAIRYLKGDGVPQNAGKAATWLHKAAQRGVAVAMYRLGMLHERGIGVARDISQARVWYERAALRGNVRAMHNLAVLFASASSGEADHDKAAYWFRKAAEHGVRDSQFNLAVLYHRGLGVKRSLADAWFWYSVAARQGDAAAAEQARKLGNWLPKDELARMRKRLATFSPTPPIRNANVVVIEHPEWRNAGASTGPQTHRQMAGNKPLAGKALVMEVQRLLKQIGYDVGPVDGIMGNRTANAIRLFQMQSRLPVNGLPDMALLQRLRQQVPMG